MPGMNRGDNLEEIYAWIDELPFSKPKKNISRDFSDGVLMAELLKIHYPRFADVHNYIPANNVAGKRENWNTLNRKVFSKIDMKLGKEAINQLANAQPGAIEKVLIDLRIKILTKDSSVAGESSINCKSSDDFIEDSEKTEDSTKATESVHKTEEISSSEILSPVVVKTSNSHVSASKSSRNLIEKFFSWLVSWMWPFSWFAKNIEKELSSTSSNFTGLELAEKSSSSTGQQLPTKPIEKDDEEASEISSLDFLQLRQEVQEKNLAIIMLNRKVSRLESAMKLKDQKIGDLAAKISPSSTETAQNLRPHVIGSSISRLRHPSKSYSKTMS